MQCVQHRLQMKSRHAENVESNFKHLCNLKVCLPHSNLAAQGRDVCWAGLQGFFYGTCMNGALHNYVL